MTEPTQTLTAVKTKTVTKTQLALALVFLGASAIAAAAMSIASDNVAGVCYSNKKIKVALTMGEGKLISACKGNLVVPSSGFGSFLVRNYNDNTLTLRIDKKYVTLKVGDEYKQIGKPVGEVPGYQQYLYVMYGGKLNKKADISLFYGFPAGEKGVFCNDTDESQKNFDGSSIKDFKFVNPYVKGTVSYYDEDFDEMVPVEDSCIVYDYGYYGNNVDLNAQNLQEGYCSTADGGKWFSKVIACEGKCVDGACVYVAPPIVDPVTPSSTPQTPTSTVGTMNFYALAIESTKLFNGQPELAKIQLLAMNEDVVLKSVKFNLSVLSGKYSTTTLSNLYLFDVTDSGLDIQLAGPLSLIPDKSIQGWYSVVFDNLNFMLPKYSLQLTNWKKKLQLRGQVGGVSELSHVGVWINPAKDIVGVGSLSGQTISPAVDKTSGIADLFY